MNRSRIAALIMASTLLAACGSSAVDEVRVAPSSAPTTAASTTTTRLPSTTAATTTTTVPPTTSTTISTSPPVTIPPAEVAPPAPPSDGPTWNANVSAWCYLGCIAPSAPCVLPDYICSREARFIDQANNGWMNGHSACGKYQFVRSTWAGFGGYAHACIAPEATQDAKAVALWDNGNGCSHWSAC